MMLRVRIGRCGSDLFSALAVVLLGILPLVSLQGYESRTNFLFMIVVRCMQKIDEAITSSLKSMQEELPRVDCCYSLLMPGSVGPDPSATVGMQLGSINNGAVAYANRFLPVISSLQSGSR